MFGFEQVALTVGQQFAEFTVDCEPTIQLRSGPVVFANVKMAAILLPAEQVAVFDGFQFLGVLHKARRYSLSDLMFDERWTIFQVLRTERLVDRVHFEVDSLRCLALIDQSGSEDDLLLVDRIF